MFLNDVLFEKLKEVEGFLILGMFGLLINCELLKYVFKFKVVSN